MDTIEVLSTTEGKIARVSENEFVVTVDRRYMLDVLGLTGQSAFYKYQVSFNKEANKKLLSINNRNIFSLPVKSLVQLFTSVAVFNEESNLQGCLSSGRCEDLVYTIMSEDTIGALLDYLLYLKKEKLQNTVNYKKYLIWVISNMQNEDFANFLNNEESLEDLLSLDIQIKNRTLLIQVTLSNKFTIKVVDDSIEIYGTFEIEEALCQYQEFKY